MPSHAFHQLYLYPHDARYDGSCNQQVNKCYDKIARTQKNIVHPCIKVEHIKKEQLRHKYNSVNGQGNILQYIEPTIVAGEQQQPTIDNENKTEINRDFRMT